MPNRLIAEKERQWADLHDDRAKASWLRQNRADRGGRLSKKETAA